MRRVRIPMHEELFGQRLRAQRERRRITLESIAANTKISIGLLRDLENDRIARWPGGIFGRSFLRSYAAAIGLDPEETLEQFLARHPDRSSAAELDAIDKPTDQPKGNGRSPRGVTRPMLRLTLADDRQPVSPRAVLSMATGRLLAVACDLAVPATLAAGAYVLIGSFWAPFGVALSCYLLAGILVLGNTPGTFLQVWRATARPQPRPTPEPPGDEASHLVFEESLIR